MVKSRKNVFHVATLEACRNPVVPSSPSLGPRRLGALCSRRRTDLIEKMGVGHLTEVGSHIPPSSPSFQCPFIALGVSVSMDLKTLLCKKP